MEGLSSTGLPHLVFMISVHLTAHAERFVVSRMQDFFLAILIQQTVLCPGCGCMITELKDYKGKQHNIDQLDGVEYNDLKEDVSVQTLTGTLYL